MYIVNIIHTVRRRATLIEAAALAAGLVVVLAEQLRDLLPAHPLGATIAVIGAVGVALAHIALVMTLGHAGRLARLAEVARASALAMSICVHAVVLHALLLALVLTWPVTALRQEDSR